MSYASENRRANPTSMALAVAVNGSIILAVALSPLVVEPRKPGTGTTTFDVPTEKPPEPDIKPKDEETKPLDTVYAPKPVVKGLPQDETKITTGDKETTETVVAGGTGEATEIFDKPKDPPPPPSFKAATRDPRHAASFQPEYPSNLLQREIEGTASVRVLIGADGRVREANVVSATHPDFGKATVKQALRAWRFRPATRGGEPVEDWQTLSVRFTINA